MPPVLANTFTAVAIIPEVMAVLRNAAVATLRFVGYTKITETLRTFAEKPIRAVNLMQ